MRHGETWRIRRMLLEAKMGIFIYGNDPNQNLTVASGDISHNIVKFGNGAGDNVSNIAAPGDISYNIIAFGNGAGDNVEAVGGNVTHNVITFGDGGGDFVS